jgi:hypothetical protein
MTQTKAKLCLYVLNMVEFKSTIIFIASLCIRNGLKSFCSRNPRNNMNISFFVLTKLEFKECVRANKIIFSKQLILECT